MRKGLLRYVAHLSLKALKSGVKNLSASDLKAIRGMMMSLLDGTFPLRDQEIEMMSPHKAFIRKMAYEGIRKCELNKYCNSLLKVLRIARPILKRFL